MQFYDSLERKKKTFGPLEGKKVVMYVCGLTPYDHSHIGHARTYVAFDMLKRWLIQNGYKVFHIQNVTDVDDKIIRRAKESKRDPKQITEQYQNEADELLGKLHVIPADAYPKVTENIPQIISLIKKIMENGYAYETETGVYFEISKFADYGKLSGQKLDEMQNGSRKEVDESKKSPGDFALWKKTKDEIIEFDSPWGRGRPGWHIECSAMSGQYAKTLDIHGGARDLIFPHHENELAQSEAANSKQFVRYWLHTGFLTVKGEKMSKSLGNFVTIKKVLEDHSPNAIRMFFALSHYRSPIDYNPEQIKQAESTVERIFNFMDSMECVLGKKEKNGSEDASLHMEMKKKFGHVWEFMANDFDIPNALAYVFSIMKSMNMHLEEGKTADYGLIQYVHNEMEKVLYVMGLEQKKKTMDNKTKELLDLIIELREEARKKKDFSASDHIRDKLKGLGISLEDSKNTKCRID